MLKLVKYTKGNYRYILTENHTVWLSNPFSERRFIDHKYFSLRIIPIMRVRLVIKKGYAWDGATGLPDLLQAKHLQIPSLVHDVFCQMTNDGLLPWSPWRKYGDKAFKTLYPKGNYIRSTILYTAIRLNSFWEQFKRRGR